MTATAKKDKSVEHILYYLNQTLRVLEKDVERYKLQKEYDLYERARERATWIENIIIWIEVNI
jgi:hypothetical protein